MTVRLYPRHRIDVALPDLSRALRACSRDPDASDSLQREEAHRLESALCSDRSVIATLSVRSAFDLLLAALALPPGSEVMLSALTIPDMARVVRAHGLVPVPVDVDPGTLSPTRDALERAWSPMARVLVVAQLFGARADTAATREFAARKGLLWVDDDAQGYTGPHGLAPRDAAVVFHSFGSIKTATCLGGALARVRDPALLASMRALHARWPVHPTRAWARKLALYAALLLPRQPPLYSGFALASDRLGPGLDRVVTSMTRGFSAGDTDALLAAIRRRPCGPLLSTLHARLGSFDGARVARRAQAGEELVARLRGKVPVLGSEQRGRTHWLFAVQLARPEAHIPTLRAAGFDAARGATSITAIEAPPERPELAPVNAAAIMARVLFVPAYPEIPERERARLATVLAGLEPQ